jgi:phosphoglucomutase
LGGDLIQEKITAAPGNGAAIGGIKLSMANGWAAARPSGTEDVYKIYAESFVSAEHLTELQSDAAKFLETLVPVMDEWTNRLVSCVTSIST